MAKGQRPAAKGLASIGKVAAASTTDAALRALEAQQLPEARRLAVQTLQGTVSAVDKRRLAAVFYAHGKHVVASGDLRGALADFGKACELHPEEALFGQRNKANAVAELEAREREVKGSDGRTVRAISADEVRRHDVVRFANEVARELNYSLRELTDTPLLDYLQTKRLLHPALGTLSVQLDSFTALGVYRWMGDPLASDEFTGWIRRFKNQERELATHLGAAMAEWVRRRTRLLASVDVIVAVPGDPGRLRERGYNPPGELARVIARRLGVPLIEGALLKRGAPRARDLQRNQVDGNFLSVTEATQLRGRTVLLVDDVATRGYTLSACSARLRELGAVRVDTLVLAQSVTSHREEVAVARQVATEVTKVAEWLHLAEATHVGPERFKALVAAFGSPRAVFDDLPRAATVANNAQATKGLHARRGREDEARAAAERALEAATRSGGAVLLSDDARYPARLLRSRATPPLLYVRGRVEHVQGNKPWLAIVGSREATAAAERVAREVARALAGEGWVIVSGMADGIDQAAHEAALDARGLTVAVLPSGPDVATPASARPLYERIVETGLVVSEYPFGVHARSDSFKKRNQVTVGLSDAVLVVQSAVDGGTMIAAKAATEDGRLLLTLEPLDAHAFGGNQKLLDDKLAQGVPARRAVDFIRDAVRARTS